jgi:energy-coupling factor transporter ATP-binding protein EcfA2
MFENFKAFEHYSVTLDKVNILVGPNNSGKSTLVGALRVLAQGIRIAKSRKPERIYFGEDFRVGYRISEASLPISLENVHTNYAEVDSSIIFTLSNKNKIILLFPSDGGCILIPSVSNDHILSAAQFKKHFPIDLTVVPVLGPVEHKEELRQKDTVSGGITTHRAARHFRSYWYHFGENFEEFANLIKKTWPGMEIRLPEITDHRSNVLSMFCFENRMMRELYWVGFGFQIWCQLLTHLSHARDSSIIVIDEPEIYLHPDIQRQLLSIVRDIGPDIVLATHSTEIMSEADPSEIVLIDKRKRTAERLKDVDGVQRALEAVGSIQNITLTTLARSRRVLFVEGDDDFRLLRKIARKIGMQELSAGLGITPLPSGGFGSWQRITNLASGIAEALGTPLIIAAIYDRDYFCAEEIDEIKSKLSTHLKLAYVHERKEIENYLLVPEVLDRALARATADRAARSGEKILDLISSSDLLLEVTNPMMEDIQSQMISKRISYLKGSSKDISNITKEKIEKFHARWKTLDGRLKIAPGKEVIATFREKIHSLYGVSLTDSRIIDSFHHENFPDDLIALLDSLESFRKLVAKDS